MTGVVKDVVITTLTPTTILVTTFDSAIFAAGWVVFMEDATDRRVGYSQGNPNVQKIVISPIGVPYPGDAVPGEGSRKLTIDFLGAPATVVMTQVEVDPYEGWLIVYKGDHLIAYNPSVIDNAISEPTP